MTKHVKNNLHCRDVRILNGFERFFNFFNADPKVTDLALIFQAVETFKNFRPIIYLGGRTMELNEIKGFKPHIFQVVEKYEIAHGRVNTRLCKKVAGRCYKKNLSALPVKGWVNADTGAW